MELKEGDLIITLPKVKMIQAVVNLKGGEIGIIIDAGVVFDKAVVYGVIINEQIYYLFEDEFEKLEE